jgi:hypothetical protein
MAVLKMKVVYTDSRESVVAITPRAQVETERHFKGTDQAGNQRIQSHYYLAWASLFYGKKETGDYEEFLDKVADVEEVTAAVEDENASDPTPETATTTGSSD